MGGCLGRSNQNFEYSLTVQPQREGQTAVYRRPATALKLEEYPDEKVRTLKEIYLQSVKTYGNRPFFSSRNPKNGNKYSSKSYNEVFKLTEQLGAGLLNFKLVNEVNEYQNINMKVIGLYSKTREEWLLLICLIFFIKYYFFYKQDVSGLSFYFIWIHYCTYI